MITYNKILLTHDGSKLASTAIPHAISLAKTYNAELLVLEIVDLTEFIPADVSLDSVAAKKKFLNKLIDSEKKAARQLLKSIKDQLNEAGIEKVTIVIEEGDARDKIIKIAKSHACDVIVMATHGRTGLKRALLGSIADNVMQNASCPVFLIRPEKEVLKK